MSELINIGGNPNDVNYRYKRNQIDVERVSRNGGMRRIRNLTIIVKQLTTSMALNVSEFENEFYARVKRRGIRVLDGGWFKGDVVLKDLERIMNDMITEIILCPRCKLPEWDHRYCKSCGHTKSGKKKRKQQKEDDEEEEGSVVALPHLSQAVSITKQLYDRRSTTHDPKDLALLNQALDLFWTITEDNEATHLKWINAMETKFSL
jgi:uncharacterized Zn finger protein (UPF0148 family)